MSNAEQAIREAADLIISLKGEILIKGTQRVARDFPHEIAFWEGIADKYKILAKSIAGEIALKNKDGNTQKVIQAIIDTDLEYIKLITASGLAETQGRAWLHMFQVEKINDTKT